MTLIFIKKKIDRQIDREIEIQTDGLIERETKQTYKSTQIHVSTAASGTTSNQYMKTYIIVLINKKNNKTKVIYTDIKPTRQLSEYKPGRSQSYLSCIPEYM